MRLSREEIYRIEEIMTLPELMEALEIDYEDLRGTTLSCLYNEYAEEILEILEDYS